MARTKQTARKSTGGKKPRKALPGKFAHALKGKGTDPVKRKHGNGFWAIREIRRYQKDYTLLTQFEPFVRAVKSAAKDMNTRYKRSALVDLQYALEAHIVSLCECSNLHVIHAKRMTLMPKDLELTKKIGAMAGCEVYMQG